MLYVPGVFGVIFAAACLAATSPSLAQIERPTQGAPVVVTNLNPGGFLNVRAEPSPSAPILVRLTDRDTATLTGKRQKYDTKWWVEIHTTAGNGWVNGHYLAPSTDSVGTPRSPNFDRRLNTEIEFDAFREFPARSIDQCEAVCLSDQRCAAAEFYKDRQQCGLQAKSSPTATSTKVDTSILRSRSAPTAVNSAPVSFSQDTLDEEGTHWELNGNKLLLTIEGDAWTFRYLEPRPGIVEEGVKRGTVLFRGSEAGTMLVGTAYRFSKRCGPLPYQVSGQFEPEGGILTLGGIGAKGLDKSCRVTHTESYTLSFKPLDTEKSSAPLSDAQLDAALHKFAESKICAPIIKSALINISSPDIDDLKSTLIRVCVNCVAHSMKDSLNRTALQGIAAASSLTTGLRPPAKRALAQKIPEIINSCSRQVNHALETW